MKAAKIQDFPVVTCLYKHGALVDAQCGGNTYGYPRRRLSWSPSGRGSDL
jgi:hypothetical protein